MIKQCKPVSVFCSRPNLFVIQYYLNTSRFNALTHLTRVAKKTVLVCYSNLELERVPGGKTGKAVVNCTDHLASCRALRF